MAKNTKWHINKEGIPKPCTATKRKCPLGDVEHFETQAEAAAASERALLEKYGVSYDDNYSSSIADDKVLQSKTFLQQTYVDKYDMSRQDTELQAILRDLRGSKSSNIAGEQYESFGALAYAEDMNLENTIVIGAEGARIYSNMENAESESNKALNNAYSMIQQKMADQGLAQFSQTNYIRTLHYSDDGETAVAHMGGSSEGMLDLAVIRGSEVEIVEFKRASNGGAQIMSTSIKVDENGKPNLKGSGIEGKVAEQIKRHGFKSTFGTNVNVNITHRESLEYMVDSYKQKGATKFSYLNKKGNVVEVDLKGDTPSVVRRLEENNIQATVKLRSNMTSGVPSKADKARWQEKRGDCFKSGKVPTEGTFTLKDVNPKYLNYEGESVNGYATVGEIVLPIKRADLRKFDKDTPIEVKKLKVRNLTVIGEVKEVTPKKK